MDTNTQPTATATGAAYLARKPMIEVMGVDYLHLQLADGSDLYLTEFGMPFSSQLLPDNHWGDKAWLTNNRIPLHGTSNVYRVRTKEVAGLSKDIVLKWNRMGQDIPGETQVSDLAGAAFNSPFEEFSLVIELRNARSDFPRRIHTHRPLGIYVPRKYVDSKMMGRRQYILRAIQEDHSEITLDVNRNYAVIYEWIKGIDASQTLGEGLIDKETMRGLIVRSNLEMRQKGFWVRDSKPHHVIVRPGPDGQLARERNGRILYAMVDFELLERTPEHEKATRATRRKAYLVKQAHRFEVEVDFPPDLSPVNVLGVDYVFGKVESTGGRLWVVGKDPALFEYFLPEKWRKTPRARLSDSPQAYDTITKDNIHLVWRTSRVGRRPDIDPTDKDAAAVLAYGYNSPFEEIFFSLELTRQGLNTTYPRAVYMTGSKPEVSDDLVDDSRYRSHRGVQTPGGHKILSENHDHIIIWGHWNGPDELLATIGDDIFKPIDAMTAVDQGLISASGYARVVETTRQRLTEAGVEAPNIQGSHLLLSLDKSDRLVTDDGGMPTVRICNFELMRRVGDMQPPAVIAHDA